jgi:hypothetical protein
VERDGRDPARLDCLALCVRRNQSGDRAGIPLTGLAFAGFPGSNFNVTGVPIACNAALIDAGADQRINPQAKVGLCYWGQQASTAHANGLRAP